MTCHSVVVDGICRGTFVEFRKGMMNVSPIGRNARHVELDSFPMSANGVYAAMKNEMSLRNTIKLVPRTLITLH